MADYLIGTAVTLIATFKDADAVLADPATVTFKVLKPDGMTDSYVYGDDIRVIKDSTGIYHLTIEPVTDGPFYWRVEGAGADVDTAAEDKFTMDAGAFA